MVFIPLFTWVPLIRPFTSFEGRPDGPETVIREVDRSTPLPMPSSRMAETLLIGVVKKASAPGSVDTVGGVVSKLNLN